MKSRLLATFVTVILLGAAGAAAGSVGVPVPPDGGTLLVGFEEEGTRQEVDGEILGSTAYLGRVAWRVRAPLTFALLVGGSEVDVESAVHGKTTDFEGRAKLAVGAGASWIGPALGKGLHLFADMSALHVLSEGETNFQTTIQSSVFREEYYNRYSWTDFRIGGGVRWEAGPLIPYAGFLGRALDGNVSRETYQTGQLVVDETEDFSRGFLFYALGGVEYWLSESFLVRVTASARGSDDYAWTVGIAELGF
ncbi:MAG: hypothetical protein JW958_08475 [Candidatus Eisenbacteria bacterium]|nr:hypothetical protein [Candidatus Eisenbacteria bacterium]